MLRMNTPIVMRFVSPMGYREIPTSAYEVKYNAKKWLWPQRLCVWFLRKQRTLSLHFDREMVVKSVLIEPDTAARKILDIADEQLARVDYRPERILLGRKQFEEIVSDTPDIFRQFSFNIPVTRSTPAWNGLQPSIERFGVAVYVIPWMDGVLVL